MTEEERLNEINRNSQEHLQRYLEQLDEGDITHDDLLSIVYAGMVTAGVMGYSLESLVEDSRKASDQIIELVKEHEDE